MVYGAAPKQIVLVCMKESWADQQEKTFKQHCSVVSTSSFFFSLLTPS